MLDQKYNLAPTPNQAIGDLAALAEQLGSAEGLCQLPLSAVASETARIETWPALARFIEGYAAKILLPHELPAIARAYGHVTRYEVRELVSFDQELGQNASWLRFAQASRAVGFRQLERLRPLRGERLVQRYLKAVEEGQANAWHTIVFGLVLALYSLPLRQGMLHFAQQTLGGFTQAASSRIKSDSADRARLLEAQSSAITAAVDRIIGDASALVK